MGFRGRGPQWGSGAEAPSGVQGQRPPVGFRDRGPKPFEVRGFRDLVGTGVLYASSMAKDFH